MWPATGMLVAGGLTALACAGACSIETFVSLKRRDDRLRRVPLGVVGIGVFASGVALCVVQALLLGMPVWMTLAAIVLSVPLMLVGLRVLGETNWGPISALSNMMQGVFAAIAPGNIAANMVARGTTGTIATSSEAIMQDYQGRRDHRHEAAQPDDHAADRGADRRRGRVVDVPAPPRTFGIVDTTIR